jgi:hypothetical protein
MSTPTGSADVVTDTGETGSCAERVVVPADGLVLIKLEAITGLSRRS